jgi:alkaline phosphatase D
MAANVNRRTFVGGAAATALVVATNRTAANALPRLNPDPFTLGVASGDPTPWAVVIWTRLAPQPTEDGGGMPARPYRVRYEVSTNPNFSRIVRRGYRVAFPHNAHSVHVDVRGLRPGRWYWYRFRVGNHISEVGRTRTVPRAVNATTPLSFAQMSCQRYSSGFYGAYADIVAQEPDLMVHVGDYIYEVGGSGAREDALPESITLDQYRNRYGLYKSDPNLRAAHAAAPWLLTWDDHEAENNYTGLVPEASSTTPDPAAFLARRTAAYKAYWEHQPLRRRPNPDGSLSLYRRMRWGRTADLLMLDTRQYRDDQLCGTDDLGALCDAAFDPEYTVLGKEQEQWVTNRVTNTRAAWSVLAGGTVFSRMSLVPGEQGAFNLDGWDGYPLARQRLLDALAVRGQGSSVLLSGDIHAHLTSAVLGNFEEPDDTELGAEFTTTSISTNGSVALNSFLPSVVSSNPGVRWADGSVRGWVHHRVSATEWSTDHRAVDDHTDANTGASTVKSWTLPKGGRLSEA